MKDGEDTNNIVVGVAKLANVKTTKDKISTYRLAAKPKRNAIDDAA